MRKLIYENRERIHNLSEKISEIETDIRWIKRIDTGVLIALLINLFVNILRL